MSQAATISSRAPKHDIYIAAAMVSILAVMLLPLPPLLMDLFLSVSVCLSLLTFLVAIYLRDPLELSVFPSLVLVATLLRLSLNVASTRLILMRGSEGPEAAGSVIKAFGQFVVGGNYVVGIILFLILVVINFVVITKGAGRVAEVSARFALDGLPGKQMAIDADLGAGLINDTQAAARRSRLQDEADFHGAMDGASKFVRGDAIAGLIITAINVVAGITIGVLQHGMAIGEAGETFTILTVGDGLVSQIPGLLMSTAAGIVVTRSAGEGDLGTALVEQLGRHRRPAAIAAFFLAALALVPGMPHLTFLVIAAASGAIAYFGGGKKDGAQKGDGSSQDAGAGSLASADGSPADRESVEALLPIDLLALEIGYELVGMADGAPQGNLLGRIASIRRQFATELGIIVPPIHVRDNLSLAPDEYRLLLLGNPIGGGTVRVGRYLAMDPGGVLGPIEGEAVVEPAFGLPARWVGSAQRPAAESLGYTVVDASTVIATHLSELLRRNAHELLGRAEVQELLDIFSKTNANVVDELVPNLLSLGDVIKVLRNLLREGISIRDLRTILETLADHGAQVKDPDALTELVRQRMAKHLTARVQDADGRVHALVLDPGLEQDLRHALRAAGGEMAAFDGQAIPRVLGAIERSIGNLADSPVMPVLVVSPDVRPHLSAFTARHVQGLQVYSYREIAPNAQIQTLGVVGAEG
ncbi:MAG: flagellar biosynthesis protein FlhA [Myxococcales bacterium]|nr:flagellar biosynthesis protein FlhA [Myxococcales bacterium]